MKIGILGGSFDPIHNGHIYMAEAALKEYKLDQVWLMPAGHSPNKNESNMTSAIDRYNMCCLAASDNDKITASDFELKLENTSYTYRTLSELKKQYPEHNFYFIMGADSLDYFKTWKHPEIIASLCTILVVIRDSFSIENMSDTINDISSIFSCDIRLLKCPKFDVSSTMIRDRIKNSISCNQYMNSKVIEYIENHHLYLP